MTREPSFVSRPNAGTRPCGSVAGITPHGKTADAPYSKFVRAPSPLSRASRCAEHEHRRRGGGAGVGEQQVAVRSLA
jgi:hypothetical protein